ncbi:hypothetical protein EMCRGX_G027458 [Ephydatia muelleri]|eukprot:Em0020g1094a
MEDGRYEAYMIPPNISNHASFLEILPSGDLILAWFSGDGEGTSNCSIVVTKLLEGSELWPEAIAVSWRVGFSNQNPVLFRDSKSGLLYLFHSQQPASGGEELAHIWMLYSADEGVTWSTPTLLFSENGIFDRNRIILSLTGSWVYPMYYSLDTDYSAMFITANQEVWSKYTVQGSDYLIQPSVIRPQSSQPYLLAFFRDERQGFIYNSTSTDDGVTWSTPSPTNLPNNDAAIQATVLKSGNIALVFNPTHDERYPIRIALSMDQGKTWPYYRDIDTGLPGCELSYPSILQSPDGYIHVSYTYNRQTIKYVKFMEDWIVG